MKEVPTDVPSALFYLDFFAQCAVDDRVLLLDANVQLPFLNLDLEIPRSSTFRDRDR